MNKASEYRRHAVECRQFAALMDGDPREQLLEMATTWEQLAEERERLLRLEEPSSFSEPPELQ